jgi:hypothetical protein
MNKASIGDASLEQSRMNLDSWAVKQWPANVFPGSASRGRRVVREHRNQLVQAGAVVRVGRELVVIGARYQKWLERQATNVPGFECAANRQQAATS